MRDRAREWEKEGAREWRPGKYIRSLSSARPDALLRSASGPEVKGSAIRRGIGNYSPERGRALVTFITELSASLGKQCASFNPRSPVPLTPAHPRTASILFPRTKARSRARLRPASSVVLFPSLSSSFSLSPLIAWPFPPRVLADAIHTTAWCTFFSLHP